MKRAVSSSRRTQAIFSSVFRAAISLLNVRMFFSSVLNLIVGQVRAEGPFGRVETRQECPPRSVSHSIRQSRLGESTCKDKSKSKWRIEKTMSTAAGPTCTTRRGPCPVQNVVVLNGLRLLKGYSVAAAIDDVCLYLGSYRWC